jgi:pfkB family carbohydrate kinase
MTRLSDVVQEQPPFVLAGSLRRDYLLPPEGRPMIDVPGGDLLYAAAGLGVWFRIETGAMMDGGIGLLARVGEDYPHDWLLSFRERGWDTRGIRILAEALDLRYFQATLPNQVIQHSNPVAHFGRLGLPFPKSLLGYQPPVDADDNREVPPPASPRPNDIPPDYLSAHAAHICPLDYLTTNRLTSAFQQASVTTLTMDPSPVFLTAAAFEDVRILVHGLTAFLPSEEELRALFWGRTDDLWQMAEALGQCGCEFIIVKRGARGQMLYDSASKKRWEIPAYPASPVDLTGAGASFCGGFLAGYQQTYDPLRGVLYGSVSASLAIEGSGAFHALETLPGLARARLDSLSGIVRQV